MEWFKIILSGIISSTVVISAATFVLRESFKKLLERDLEQFKSHLTIEAKKHEFTRHPSCPTEFLKKKVKEVV